MRKINQNKKCYIVARFRNEWHNSRQLMVSLMPLPENYGRGIYNYITLQTIKFKTAKELQEKLGKVREHFKNMRHANYYPYQNLSNLSRCASNINQLIKNNQLCNWVYPAPFS